MGNLTLEQRLVIEMCRPKECISIENIIHKMESNEIDWKKILEISKEQKVAPYVADSIRELGNKISIPNNVILEFEKIKNICGSRNLTYEKLLCDIVLKLKEVNIVPIALKGPVFNNLLYKSKDSRQSVDLDIMIKHKDHKIVREKLSELGIVQGEIDTNGKIRLYTDEYVNEYALHSKHAAGYILLKDEQIWNFDIHHNLFWSSESYKIDYDDLLENHQDMMLGDVDIYIPSDVDILLHTCVHSYWHSSKLYEVFERNDIHIKQYQDIYMALNSLSDSIDWEVFIERVKKLRLDIPVGVSFYQTELIFGDMLPDKVKNIFYTKEINKQSDALYETISGGDKEPLTYWEIPFLVRLFDMDKEQKIQVDSKIMEKVKESSTWFQEKSFTN